MIFDHPYNAESGAAVILILERYPGWTGRSRRMRPRYLKGAHAAFKRAILRARNTCVAFDCGSSRSDAALAVFVASLISTG